MAESSVRIFVSSPSDVEHERALVKDIIEVLGQEYLPYFKLQAVLWEEEALTAAKSFQAGLVRPSDCDIVLVMLWSRLGTPLADDPYGGMTGTEWEFVDAVEASSRQGTPEVLVYKKTSPRLIDINNPEAVSAAVDDRDRLDAFFRTHFFNPDGSFRRAFRQFDNDASFRALVETQLRKLLHRRISAERRFAAGAEEWLGSPFRAHAPFDVGDSRIFTGRESETRELVARLDSLAERGRGLLLLTGPNGVGKTSLLRAGLVPHLVRPFLFSGIGTCRWCLVEPDPAAPLATLARALTAPGMLGVTLSAAGLDAARLARLLAKDPKVAAEQIQAALEQASQDELLQAGHREGRLQIALILDPLDELAVEPHLSAAGTAAFIAALAELAAQDGIWLVGALRSDRLPQLTQLPGLADALDIQSWLALGPPPVARLRQVMEIPARVAGIEYEEGAKGVGHGLVERLESEIGELTHWPSALEHTLEELYRRAHTQSDQDATARASVLTLRDLQSLGGLTGSLVRRADAVWASLGEEERASLPMLCRALISLEGISRARPAPREGDLETLLRHADCAALIRRLMDARLLIADAVPDPACQADCAVEEERFRDHARRALQQVGEEWRARFVRARGAGAALGELLDEPPSEQTDAEPSRDEDLSTLWRAQRAVVSFIHPALIERWEPVQAWLRDRDNRQDLALRHQISRQARLWKRTDCNREYLFGEVGYAAAHAFAERYHAELEPLEHGFLERCRTHLRFQRRRNRWALTATLATLALLAGVTAYSIWDARREARLGAQRIVLQEANAALARGNPPRALRLALAAGPDLPDIAVDTLARAMTTNRLVAMTTPAEESPGLAPVFSDDGTQLVTLSKDRGTRLWRREGPAFKEVAVLAGPEIELHSVHFAGSGERVRIIGMGPKGVWLLPATGAGAPTWRCTVPPSAVLAQDDGGRFLAISHGGPQDPPVICMIDLDKAGAPLWDRGQEGEAIRRLAFSPDGTRLASASRNGLIQVMDAVTGAHRMQVPREGAPGRGVTRVLFSPDGRRIAVASLDESIRLYDEQGDMRAELGSVKRGKRAVKIHQSSVRDLAFTPDGQVLVAGDSAGQVVRWDLRTASAQVLGQHDLGVDGLLISPDVDPTLGEFLVLTFSQDGTARLWTLDAGHLVAVSSHDAPVADARFSRDGAYVMTTAKQDGSARLWSIATSNPLAARLPHADHVYHLTVARTAAESAGSTNDAAGAPAELIATAGYDGLINVWRYQPRAANRKPVKQASLIGHHGRVRRVEFSPSSHLIASGGTDGTARIWSAYGTPRCTLRVASDSKTCRHDTSPDCPSVFQLAFLGDEHSLITASSDAMQPFRLWNLDDCAASPMPEGLSGARGGARAIARGQDPEGALLVAAGSEDGVVRLLRRNQGGGWDKLCQWDAHQGIISDLSFARGGHWLAAASRDGLASIMRFSTEAGSVSCGKAEYLDGKAGAVYSAQFAPDGRALLTTSFEAKAHLWALDGSLIAELGGHLNRVTWGELSADGRWIMTASRDGALRLWKRPSKAQAQPLPPYLTLDANLGTLTSARFTSDGRDIAAGYWDNAGLLWRIWSQNSTPDPSLVETWGKERARLTLVEMAEDIKARHLDR